MIRTNLYLLGYQKEKLEKIAEEEHTSSSEIARRAIDAYLAWRDPVYQPEPLTPQMRKSQKAPP
ncbi:MAG TPA: ribbon-helix-helix protein, CopG family [Ktedonobacteraceae bacterium]